MIDLFKEEVNIGNIVKLILTTGKEPIGKVLEIGSNHILIENEEGNTIRIFEVLIGGWEIIKENEIVQHDNNLPRNEELSITEKKQEVLIEEEKVDNKIKETTIVEKIEEKEENCKSEENKIGVSIVGKISLDKIDTKKNRFPTGRTYRLRQVSKTLGLPINKIIELLKKEKIDVDENNPNYRIDQAAYDVVIKEKDTIKNEKKSTQETSLEKITDIGLKFNSLSDLSKLKEKIEIDISKQMLPANAKIKRYGARHQYGFLTGNDGLDYHFRFSEIKDDILLEKLNVFGTEGIQVICQLNNYNGRLIAKSLYLPQSVESFHKKAELYFNQDNVYDALELLKLILTHFPDYSKSLDLNKKIEYQNKRRIKGKYKETPIYHSPRIEYKKGNTELAKNQFLLSIDRNDHNSEKSIKELAYLLSGEGKYDEAIDLVTKHASKITSSDPNSFIAYFYEAKKDYSNAIEFLRKIKSKSKIDDIKISKRLALCYVGIGQYDSAEELINKVLKVRPEDTVTLKLKEALLIAKAQGSEEEIESIFKEAEISALTGGVSKFIHYALENCVFAGVPASEVSNQNFNKKTLDNLKGYIETIKDGRPRERAEAYLSQAKIEQIIDSENNKAINISIARYCTSSAVSWAKEGRSPDTMRFLLLEAATIDPVYDIIRRYIPMYLQSYFKPTHELRGNVRENWDLILDELLEFDQNQNFWIGILELLTVNSKFSTHFLTSVFKKEKYKDQSISFLNSFLKINAKIGVDKNSFLELWKNAREKLKREKDNFNAKYTALLQSSTPESFTESFLNLRGDLPEWLEQVDKHRLNILDDIVETIIEFNKQPSFEEKERYYNITLSQLNQLKEEIQDSPTGFSFNNIIPLIDFINKLIEDNYNNVIETSKPIIKIQIYGEGSKDEKTGFVNVQFAISNKKGRAPISYFILNIVNDENIEFINENNIIEQTLKGGDEQILKLKLKIKDVIIEEGATNIKIKSSYKVRGNDKLHDIEDDLTLRFYSTLDFVKINNIFATTADSGPVEDASMFFGRDDFIDNIKESIVNSKSKCVIIYGQKRSGKSSVLHHLRERLNNEENTFCISFSLGEIIQDLSPKTFYYTILTELEDSLAILSEHHENIPEYTAPEYNSLNEIPTIIFNNEIKQLKREFKKYPKWTNKKLVLLIDEFTYVYTAIQKEFLSEQFMKTWKSFLEKGFFTSVLIGQDIMPKFKAAYPNEFGVTEDKRLSYLKKSDAINLIEKPIWDTNKDRSRFLGNATNLILEYTSSNPYYVQIFCARLVDYMNDNKAISVTEADVHDVADSFIKGEQALTADKFDNLITAGDADLDAFDSNDVLTALKTIAIASKNLDSCPREAINLGE
ncbi:MAG: hypothetical protein RBT65_16300, partial [Methanolobus sp.]|nr:hypothetical protein [Methanolobus sp.]